MPKQDFAAQVPGAIVVKQPRASKPAPKPAPITAYVAGPTPLAKVRPGTWGRYMVSVTLKASDPASATKLHKARAARAGYKPTKPLDFKWMLAKGFIAAA